MGGKGEKMDIGTAKGGRDGTSIPHKGKERERERNGTNKSTTNRLFFSARRCGVRSIMGAERNKLIFAFLVSRKYTTG
jgi:hypothetical protein